MCLLPLIALAACSEPPPRLDARLLPEQPNAPFPTLIELGPLLTESDTLLPDQVAQQGQSLVFRAADLRRRAAALRAMPVN